MSENLYESIGTMSQEEYRRAMREEGWSQEYFDQFDSIRMQLKVAEEARREMTWKRLRIQGRAGGEISSEESELEEKITSLKMELERLKFDEEEKMMNRGTK
jgi:hypothetical protein